MEQCFEEEPPVKTEPMDLDYCQDDIGSSEEPAAFVYDSQPILVPEMENGEVEQVTENENQVVVPSKRKRCPAKKRKAKWTKTRKKLTTAQRKSIINEHEDNLDLIQSTSKSETSYHHPTMLEDPQDLIIKTDQDSHDHPPVDLPCPPTLQHYTYDEISSAFEQCGAGTGNVKLKFADPASVFGKVYTVLTSNKKSCLYERQYLHRLWLQKYKPESLKKFGDDQIGTAFLLCYDKQLKLNYKLPKSLFHKVYTFLTENTKSNCTERKYLYDMWTIKYKETLQGPDEDPRLKKRSKVVRRKIQRRLQMQQKRDLLLQKAMIIQPEEKYPSPELGTDFQAHQDYEDGEMPPSFPQIPAEEEENQIRIRVKVEVNVDAEDDYFASDAETNEDSSVVNDTGIKVASSLSLTHVPVPDYPEPKPHEEANKDTDPKLTLEPVIRLTRLNAKKIEQQQEEPLEVKVKAKATSKDRISRKSVKSKKYDDNSAEDDLSVNEDENDDYIASEQDQNSSNDDSDFVVNTSTPVKNKITAISSGGTQTKKKIGRPRVRPIKKSRIKNTVFHKLINFRLWGKWKHHKAPNQIPIPIHIWQESHGKHEEFVVSNSCEVLKEDMEKTAPTAGKGTFANPNWIYSDVDKNDRMGPLKCVCPACGLTFIDIDELIQHRDETHREYLPMCVVCTRPMAGKCNIAPHLASHINKDQMEEFLEEEMTTLGAPPEFSSYRLYKCQKCQIIFVGGKVFKDHMDYVHLKVKRKIQRKRVRVKPDSIINGYAPNEVSECKVCGKPLSSEFISFHLRTHFNSEEEKEYLREQQKKIKKTKNVIVEKSIPGNDRTDTRIEQLKNLLEALQRRNGKEITKWPKPITTANEAPVIKKELKNVKRGGNYGPVQCATCGKVIATVYSLRVHEKVMHEGGLERKFECSICHRPFGFKQMVINHTPTHFNLEEQEKYSVWRGSLWEFLERLNTGEDLNKPPTSKIVSKGMKERRPIRKKRGRPRKHHHLYKDKMHYRIRDDGGGQDQSQPSCSGGAAAIVSARNLEGVGVAEGEETSTSTFSSAAEVPNSTLQHWNTAYGQGQQGQDGLGY